MVSGLNLNVVTPANVSPDSKLPVVVVRRIFRQPSSSLHPDIHIV